jgi:hypothetical protein
MQQNSIYTLHTSAFHLPICVTTLTLSYLESFASERASSQSLYPVLYFLFSLQRVSSTESNDRATELFFCIYIPLAAAAKAAVLTWRISFGRRGHHIVSFWLLFILVEYMDAVLLCKSRAN